MNRHSNSECFNRVAHERDLDAALTQGKQTQLTSDWPSVPCINRADLDSLKDGSSLSSDLLNPVRQQALLRQQALSEARRGCHADAIAILSHVIDCFPMSAVDHNNRGLMYQHIGDFDKAIQDYNTALRYDADLDSAYNNRANCYAVQGQKQEAIADYHCAINLNPYNFRARINLAITLRELGDLTEAIANLDIALQLCGETPLAAHMYAERGRTYHLSGDWNCAFADYRRAMAWLKRLSVNSQSVALNDLQGLGQRVKRWVDQLAQATVS